ncbi:MAG: hypothetical protein K0S68_490 [Candidatus Saccharibacteria bacterium]|nr:hypothetical protein [Candidatus Saccharibacteria bacterium]
MNPITKPKLCQCLSLSATDSAGSFTNTTGADSTPYEFSYWVVE